VGDVGQAGRDQAPDYRHPPVTTVPLKYPLRLFGRTVRELRLSPPSYGDLVRIREAPRVTGHDILMAMTGEALAVILSCRWPDVEAALAAGLDLLPPDLRALLEAPMTEEEDESATSIRRRAGIADPGDFLTQG
jgi:hypothetical protein